MGGWVLHEGHLSIARSIPDPVAWLLLLILLLLLPYARTTSWPMCLCALKSPRAELFPWRRMIGRQGRRGRSQLPIRVLGKPRSLSLHTARREEDQTPGGGVSTPASAGKATVSEDRQWLEIDCDGERVDELINGRG